MRILATLPLLLIALAPSPVRAEDRTEAKRRAVYERLMREIEQIDRDYGRVHRAAIREARLNGGNASLETKSEMLTLLDRRDRKISRLMILTSDHPDWPMPPLEPPTTGEIDPVVENRPGVLDAADAIIRARFTREARGIAAAIAFPVVDVPDPENE